MANHIDVTFVTEFVYEFWHDFKDGPFEKEVIVASYSNGIFILYANEQKSEILGDHLIFTIIQKRVCSNYKVHIYITSTYSQMCQRRSSKLELLGKVTYSHPTTYIIIPPKLSGISRTDSCFKVSCNFELQTPIKKSFGDNFKLFLDGLPDQPKITFIGSDGEVSLMKLLLVQKSKSPLFNQNESENKPIHLENFNTETLQIFCDFFSMNELKLNNETVLDLYVLSIRFDVQEMKKLVENYMLINLDNLDRTKVFEVIKTDEQFFQTILYENYSKN